MTEPSTPGHEEPPRRSRLRRVFLWSWAIVCVVAMLGALETFSRWWLVPWHQEIGSRHLQPYFMSGAYYQTPLPGVPTHTLLLGPGGPETYGYRKSGGTYVFGFDRPVNSVADRGTFLFQDRVDLANAPRDPNGFRVFVLGGSSAYGVGASQRDRRWYAVLEQSLTVSMGRDVRVIPAAMVGHVSTQERLAMELMVFPRRPDAIVILDGWNDVALPALFGVRPGDPYDLGILYGDFYSALGGTRRWLAQHSALARFFVHRSIAKAIAEQQAALLAHPDRMAQYAESTSSVYVDNVFGMLRRCDQELVPCAAFLQPARDVTVPDDSGPRNALIVAAYDRIRRRIQQRAGGGGVTDLSELLPPGMFVDTVHFTDEGHAAVARAVHPVVLEMLRDGARRQ